MGVILVFVTERLHGGLLPDHPSRGALVHVAALVLVGVLQLFDRRPGFGWRRVFGIALLIAAAKVWLLVLPISFGQQLLLLTVLSAMLVVLIAVLVARRSGLKMAAPMLAVAAAEALMVGCLGTLATLRWLELHEVAMGMAELLPLAQIAGNMLMVGVLLMVIVLDRDVLLNVSLLGVITLLVLDSMTTAQLLSAAPIPTWLHAAATFAVAMTAAGLPHLRPPFRVTPEDLAEGFEARRGLAVAVLLALTVLVFVQGLVLRPGPRLRVFSPEIAFTTATFGVLILTLMVREMTQSRRSRIILRRLRIQAGVDPLTNVGNRRALNDDVNALTGGRLSVLLVDLDKFKDVNDLVGHAAGDALLVQVAEQLRRGAAQVGASVYRMGGDEFAVLAPVNTDQAQKLARDLVEVIESNTGRIASGGHLRIGASIGIHHLPDADPVQVADAIVAAGQAMREAKAAGRSSVHVFDEGLRERYERRMRIETRLRSYFEDVELVYQPIVDTRNGQVAGFEALARWHDPVLGRVAPDEFIEIAEHSGLISDLGRHLISRAIREFALEGGFASGVFLSVNVSPLELLAPSYTSSLLSELGHWRVRPSQLLIEVTETAALTLETQIIDTLRELARAGFRLGIDDFGAGSTSVSYLPTLPLNMLKIDRRLTAGVDVKGAVILRGIVDMAKGLDLAVIMEGVETLEQYHLAVASGVPYTQGWLHAPGRGPHELFEPVGPFTS